MDQATFEANARSIRERFKGPRRALLLHLNDAGEPMEIQALLACMQSRWSGIVSCQALVQLQHDGLIRVSGWEVWLP